MHCTAQPASQQSVCLFGTPCLPFLPPTCCVLLQIRANAIKTFCYFSRFPEIANCKQRQIDILRKVLGSIVLLSPRSPFSMSLVSQNTNYDERWPWNFSSQSLPFSLIYFEKLLDQITYFPLLAEEDILLAGKVTIRTIYNSGGVFFIFVSSFSFSIHYRLLSSSSI